MRCGPKRHTAHSGRRHGQVRNSGEPYITHSVEVAKVLAGFQLDSITVASGLLHDVVEDTKVSIADVEREFGREIAATVYLSEKTVKNYVSTILSKLGMERRAQAAAFMAEQRARGHE